MHDKRPRPEPRANVFNAYGSVGRLGKTKWIYFSKTLLVVCLSRLLSVLTSNAFEMSKGISCGCGFYCCCGCAADGRSCKQFAQPGRLDIPSIINQKHGISKNIHRHSIDCLWKCTKYLEIFLDSHKAAWNMRG